MTIRPKTNSEFTPETWCKGSCPFGLNGLFFKTNLQKNELAKVRSTLESFVQVPFSKMAPNGRSHFRRGENGDGVFVPSKVVINTHLGIPQVSSEGVTISSPQYFPYKQPYLWEVYGWGTGVSLLGRAAGISWNLSCIRTSKVLEMFKDQKRACFWPSTGHCFIFSLLENKWPGINLT